MGPRSQFLIIRVVKMKMRSYVPIMFALVISTTLVGAIDLDELYKRAADAGKPPPPPPAVDPEMSAWSTDALMGMNSDSGMGSVFEEMQARHAAQSGHKKIKKGPHKPVPQVVHRESAHTPAKVARKAQEPKLHAMPPRRSAREVKRNLVMKARAKAARAKQVQQQVRQHAEHEAKKADSSPASATMLTTHVFTEQHQPTARANPHMLSAGVFGGARPAPKKRVAAPKKVVKKPVRKRKAHHAEKSLEIHLPHATAAHEAAQHKSALDILNADPERQHVDAAGASLTGLASSMLAESERLRRSRRQLWPRP